MKNEPLPRHDFPGLENDPDCLVPVYASWEKWARERLQVIQEQAGVANTPGPVTYEAHVTHLPQGVEETPAQQQSD